MLGYHLGDNNICINSAGKAPKRLPFYPRRVQLHSLQFGDCKVPLTIFRALRNTSVIWKLWKCFYKLPSSLPMAWCVFSSGHCALFLLKTQNKSFKSLNKMIGLYQNKQEPTFPTRKWLFQKRELMYSCSWGWPTAIKKSRSTVTQRGGTMWRPPQAASLALKSNLHDILGCFIRDLFSSVSSDPGLCLFFFSFVTVSF